MSDLAAFLAARLDEAAARAWAVHDVEKCDALLYEEDMTGAAARTPDCDCGYPARTLREVAVLRAVVADCARKLAYPANAPLHNLARRTLAGVASIWEDHPDYRREGAPE
jgi:hypothetical protein